MKAQVSIEYVILIGAIFITVIPLLYYSSQKTSTEINLNKAEDAVKAVGSAADAAYSLGPGSKRYVWISIPGNVVDASVNGSEILLKISTVGGTSDIYYRTAGNVTGSLPAYAGMYKIPIEVLDTGIVQIGETNVTCGDAVCSYSEDCASCSTDCGSCICGNEVCEPSENCLSCPADCGGCEKEEGEECGNGVCETFESCATCPVDCNVCGNGACEPAENYTNCPADCPLCGNGVCEYPENSTSCSADCPVTGVALKDMGVDSAWYFKTNGDGLTTKDGNMASWILITEDLLDDELTTPSTNYVIRTRSGNKYEGFTALLNQEPNAYAQVTLYGRVRIIDEDPYYLRIYPYQSDGDTPDTSVYQDYQINASILQEKVKWVEIDVTNLIRQEDGFGWIRLRITGRNDDAQNNDRLQFSELHYKVG